MNHFSSILFALLLAACTTELRYPLCNEFTPLPDEAYGVYTFTLNKIGADGRMHSIEQIIEIRDLGTDQSVDTPSGSMHLPAKQLVGIFAPKGQWTHLKQVSEPMLGHIKTGIHGTPTISMNQMCEIDSKLYAQNFTNRSTYEISRIDITSSGLRLTPVSFNTRDLSQHGFRFQHLPNIESPAKDDFLNPLQPLRLIILDDILERRAELIRLGKLVSIGSIVLNRQRMVKIQRSNWRQIHSILL